LKAALAVLIGGQFNVYLDDDYIAKGRRQHFDRLSDQAEGRRLITDMAKGRRQHFDRLSDQAEGRRFIIDAWLFQPLDLP
jgi:hypothetical protein